MGRVSRCLAPSLTAAAALAGFSLLMNQPFGQIAPVPVPSALCTSGAPSDAAPPSTVAEWASGARLFDGLGDFHRPVTTRSKDAQVWFDQGMRYLWAFNHDESTRSFAKATQLDPDCAMCWWGVALTVGPNYNLPMIAEPRAKVAWEATRQAVRTASKASPVERAMIDALTHRYRGDGVLDPSAEAPLLTAYAGAMERVAARFPNDPDVRVIAAEGMITANAWKLWTLDGKPAPGTLKILAQLDAALAVRPMHPGANHYYIHAIEASPTPEKGVASARRLDGLMPAAGHLVHMPAHIWQRVGEYEKAADANRRAIAADDAYNSLTKPPDYYGMYTAHNIQFLAFAAAMEGRKAETVQAMRDAQTAIPEAVTLAMPGVDWYQAQLYQAFIRFGMWDEMLAEPAPNPKFRAMTAGFLYGRATALAVKGRVEEANLLLAELERVSASMGPDDSAGLDSAKDVLGVADLVLKARLATAAGQDADALRLLLEAVAKEDALPYDEPADWFFPVRHQLGAALLTAGQAKEAEAVYREDLRHHPANGWALFGMTQALTAQGRTQDAAVAQKEFDKAWAHADVTLSRSAL